MAITGPIPWKGLNTKATFMNCPPGHCMSLTDWFVDYWNLSIRRGKTSLGDVGDGGNGLFYWEDPNNILTLAANILVVPSSDNKVYTAPYNGDGGALTFTDRTGATTIRNIPMHFDSLNGMLVMVGNLQNSAPQTPIKFTAYNVNAVNLGGSPPNFGFIRVVNNFMFGSGVLTSTTLSRVYWSNVGDPETWAAVNFVDFRKDDGDRITALANIGSDLIIFKQKSMGRLSTIPPSTNSSVSLGPLITLSETVGCSGASSICTLPDGTLAFMGMDSKIYRYDGTSLTTLSDSAYPGASINSMLESYLPVYQQTNFPQLYAYPTRNWILVHSITDSSGPDFNLLAFDYVNKTWSKLSWDVLDIRRLISVPRTRTSLPNVLPFVLLSIDSNGIVYWLDSTTNSSFSPFEGTGLGTAIIETSLRFGEGEMNFIPRSLIFYATSTAGDIKVTLGFDGTYLGSASYATSGGNIPYKNIVTIPMVSATKTRLPFTLQIKIEGVTASEDLDNIKISPLYVSDEVIS